MFTNTYAPLIGGIERSVATFAGDLRALGHEVLIVTLQAAERDSPTDETVLRETTFPGDDGLKCAGLTEALDRFAPDLFHVHQPFLLGERARRIARRRGLPLVFTHHTLYDREADRVVLSQLQALEHAAGRLAVAYSNQCDAVVAPTASVAAILKEQGVRGGIEIVSTGIDTERFAAGRGERFRQKYGIPGDAFVTGHLGRLIPAKRVGFLAEALLESVAKSTRTHVLFCGEGESVEEILGRFHAAGLAHRLTLVGNLHDDEVPDAYAAMDVFAFASLTDTQGIVLLEAMAAGLPVLALRATGPQDLITDGVCGRLLAPDSMPRDFAAALAELARDPFRADLAAGARRQAAAYDRRHCAVALAGIYWRALDRPRRGDAGDAEAVARPGLDELQRRVESDWRSLAEQGGAIRALLPTRGFPGLP